MRCKTFGDEFDPYDVMNNEYCSGPCYRDGQSGGSGSNRVYVQWRINHDQHWNECIREENGQAQRIGVAPTLEQAEDIVRSDRSHVLHDPLAVEVKPVEYRCP